MCASAAWWQVGRAIQGNSLSFLYAIEWPLFAVLGFLGWFALLNLEKVTEGQRRAREEYEEMMREKAQAERVAAATEEDPALAAYNDHLADLARKPKRNMFGH